MSPSALKLQLAIRDFQSARQKAAIQEILSRLTRKPNSLLSYEQIAAKLKLNARSEGGVKTIPVEAIVGSVGRVNDFTRTFLPLKNEDQQRWARVKVAFETSEAGLPPIEVYKVGEAYFVLDGNHRVSIAKREKMTSIEAHVIDVHTRVPLTPGMSPEELDDLIIQAEHADFLAETRLQELRPNVDLRMTACHQYEKLMDQIRVRRFLKEQDRSEKVSFEEATLDWYDQAYIPLTEAIQERNLLRWFPDRTIADLYLWICEYHAGLEQETGWALNLETVATALSVQENPAAEDYSATTGSWRTSRVVDRYLDKLFNDILVPLSGDASSWQTLEQALIIARKEGSKLHGLHVVNTPEERVGAAALEVQKRFNDICSWAGVEGSLVIEEGQIVQKISERARLADLTILKIVNPPMGGLASLNSPFRAVINGASGPILGLSLEASPLSRALIAFDGSGPSKEALFVGAYLAEKWAASLVVFTALENGHLSPTVQEYARNYLEFHEIQAEYKVEKGSFAALKRTILETGPDLVLMGSYDSSVFREIFIGNSLDFALREFTLPILICR